jgi:titin
VNPPNLPMFKLGTVPFIGDYIDLAPAPSFVPNGSGGWAYNTAATTTPPVFHAVWTDNRDVKPPYTKDWRDYTPPTYSGPRPDGTADIVVCLNGLAGSRNQNIYTARITGGLVVGSPQNSKQLSSTLQRAFVVFAQNTTDSPTPKTFRMTILNQPPNGRASFNQYPLPPFTAASQPPLTTIDLTIPRFTTASRTVYITSTDPHAMVTVDVAEISGVGAPAELPGGLEGTIFLNPDLLNPEVDNPEVDNPEVDNPEVDNAEVYNPEVDNPEVDNPEVDNPEVDNPEVDNPEVDNIVVGNPEVDNPEVDNPEVDNPEVDNPEVDNPEVDNGALISGGGVITDITWTIKNIGNTTTAYDINLFRRHAAPPSDGRAQLLIYRIYKTPMIKAMSCDIKTVTQNVLIANIPDPALIPPGGEPAEPNDSTRTNATLWIEPEKEVRVTLRVFDPIKADNININGASIDPEWVPESDVSLFAQAQPVNTPEAETITEPPLVGADPLPLTFTVTSTGNAGPGTLRDAMIQAEAMPGLNIIEFNLPPAAVHTIALATLLPSQEEAVIIDGSTQPGYAGAPVITIDGTAIIGGGSGFRLRGGGSLVRGLAIGGFGDHGIWFDNLGSNEAYGNYVGFDATGTAALPNGTSGVSINGPNNIVGSVAPGDRNVIGNSSFFGVTLSSSGNRIEGNYIGTDVTGAAAAPQLFGVLLSGAGASGNTVGGNVISGHTLNGVSVNGPSNLIQSNLIGVNAAGNAALPNQSGIVITDAINTRVINNTLSGNTARGIRVERVGGDPTGTEIGGNRIGTNPAGTAAIPNNMGIELAGTSNVRIGGVGADRNVISGNIVDGINLNRMNVAPNLPATSNVIKWNFIGLNAAGTAAVPNGFAGISISEGANNTIGSVEPGHRQVISGNAGPGVYIGSGVSVASNVVIGNIIGLNLFGDAAVPNIGAGVTIVGAVNPTTNTRIGGENPGEGNTISGNGSAGVNVSGAAVSGTAIQGNTIGMAANGAVDLGNATHGVQISDAGGTTVGAFAGNLGGNVISGNSGYGVANFSAPDTVIDANFIGLSASNDAGGILVTGAGSTNFRIGGGFGNRVSGNGGLAGIVLQNTPAGLVNHNFVGLNFTLEAAVPNNIGIHAENAGATVYTENVVSGNTSHGIRVTASNGAQLIRNTIGLTTLGVDPIPNGGDGIRLELLDNGLIGSAGAGNLIGSNSNAGIRLIGTTNTNVVANRVGTNWNGLVARPNGDGIIVEGASTGLIGGNAAQRNVFSGNSGFGVKVVDAAGVNLIGNYIGVDATGATALANGGGIEIQAGTVNIGDPFPVAPNVIAGNAADGILVAGGAAGNLIEANLIGVEPGGAVIPNGGHGIRVTGGRPFIIGNNIAGNGLDGVAVIGVSGITIANAIHGNGGLPIDLGDNGPTANDPLDADAGANELQNYPSITFAAGTVGGELFSAANSTYTIRAYLGSAVGNARVELGSVACNTDAAGHCNWGPIAAGAAVSGQVVTATATDALGNTSEMGVWFVVP